MSNDALKALAEAATPGPWIANSAGYGMPSGEFRITEHYVQRPGDDVSIACDIVDPSSNDHKPSEANALFIAAANPAAVLALLAEIERLKAALEKAATFAENWPLNPDNMLIAERYAKHGWQNAVAGVLRADIASGIKALRSIDGEMKNG